MRPLACLAVLAFAAACSGEDESRCGGAAARCTPIVEQRPGRASDGEEGLYVVSLRNDCEEAVDVKVCFEDKRLTADCRETPDLAPGETLRLTKSEQFFGDQLKLFVRYSSNAVQCRFPTTDRVQFR